MRYRRHPYQGSGQLPQATADALIPAMNYFAAWYVLALVAVLFIGIETRGRTIDEIDATLTARASLDKMPAAL